MKYVVVIEKSDKNYGAYVPDLPGCVAVGETREEALRLIHEAIDLHLQSMRESGELAPPPAATAESVEVCSPAQLRRTPGLMWARPPHRRTGTPSMAASTPSSP